MLAYELGEERRNAIRRKHINLDLATVELWYFDPSKLLDWLYPKVKWIYSPGFFVWSLFMIGVMAVILGSHGSMLWNDSVYFYSLTKQPLVHVVEFFSLFLLVGILHEFCHGLTCHHYGGKSHRMGFMLVYMTPAAFCDAAEAFVRASRWGRIVTIAWGCWSELLLCSYLSVLWWLTPPGTWLHNICYLIILSSGILSVMINWNPFTRLDGYFLFCEIFRFQDLKGTSTAYLVSLVRKYLFRMQATVPPLPLGRRVFFVSYALLSGVYCYLLLATLCRVLYHILYLYWPLWAFAPATLVGYRLFRSRIRKLVQFMRELYLDKKELMRRNWKPLAAIAAGIFVVLLIPIRREYAEEHFVLEPSQRAVIRATVPGRVEKVFVDEGQRLPAGAVVAQLRDLRLESATARASSQYQTAVAKATGAHLSYADFARADLERMQAATAIGVLQEQERQLRAQSPIAGSVLTPHARDLEGSYVAAGTTLAEVADTSTMRARVYVPEQQIRKLSEIHGNSLRLDGGWMPLHGRIISISPDSQNLANGLEAPPKYRGVILPAFYCVYIELDNSQGKLRDGMTGTAKIFGARRSMAGSLLEPVVDGVARRLW
jgi:putative peptide zinc metalloprotease protein